MILIGLTGSIGMGKSTAAGILRRLGLPVFDADAAVHRLQAPGGAALPAIAAGFPGVVVGGALDRAALGAAVFGNAAARQQLEAIIHPLVRARQAHFIRTHALGRRPLVALDIPLLFETGGEARVDVIAVVSAPAAIQRQRVLRRPGMTAAKFAAILESQLPDSEKRRRADAVIPSGRGKAETLRRLKQLVRHWRRRSPRRWPPGRAGNRLVAGRPPSPTRKGPAHA